MRITGRVQGVGFRYAMVAQAQCHGICGWVRNRHDGTVEAHICGDSQALAALLNWSRVGPPGARVDHLAVEYLEGDFTDFALLATT